MLPIVLALFLQNPSLTHKALPPCAGMLLETEDGFLCLEGEIPGGARRDNVVIPPEQLEEDREESVVIRDA